MTRLKIHLPQKLLGSFSIPVRITDINYGNHVGNNAIVEIIHEARAQFLQKHNFTELNLSGASLIMSELLVEYKNESFYNDQLEVALYCGEISRVAFDFYYKISTKREERTIVIALAKTGMVCFDYKIKKVISVPEAIKFILLH